MLLRTAFALIALAMPAFAQHGGHAGSFGGRASAGRAGSSGSPALSRSFASPAPGIRDYGAARYYSSRGRAGFRGAVPPNYSGFRVPYNSSYKIPYNSSYRPPYNGNRFNAGRPSYRRSGAGTSGDWNRGRFNRRRRSFNNWYSYNYPFWPGYPYVIGPEIDPGFYDWDDSDSGDSEQSSTSGQVGYGYDQGSEAPPYPSPYPGEGYGVPAEQTAATAQVAAPAPQLNPQPLTVIFKDGRSPVKMQNYMMTANVLTDLDAQHYERIPLDRIDVAATQRMNSAVGVSFQIPSAARD